MGGGEAQTRTKRYKSKDLKLGGDSDPGLWGRPRNTGVECEGLGLSFILTVEGTPKASGERQGHTFH